jgi:hypothetical protein
MSLEYSNYDPVTNQFSKAGSLSDQLQRSLPANAPPPLSLPRMFQQQQVPVMNEEASPPGQPGFPPPLSLPTFNQQKQPTQVVNNTSRQTSGLPANAPPPLSLPKFRR